MAKGTRSRSPGVATTTSRRWRTTQRLFDDTDAGARLPPRGGGRRDRREPREPRPVLVREPDDGRPRPRAGAAPRDAEARDRRDDLRLPEVRAGPVPRGGPLERLSGGDERAVRRREEGDPRRRAVVPRAVRHERDLPPPREPLRARGQLRPRDVPRDSRADPEDGRGAGERGRRRSCSGATGRRPASSSTSTTASRALALAAERYDGADPVNLGTGEEIAIRDLAELVRDATGFDGEIRWDTSKPNGQPRRRLDTSRAEALFGFKAAVPLRDGIARTVAWYRSSVAG